MPFARVKRFLGSLIGVDMVPESGIEYVDYYLELWDQFARGCLNDASRLGEAEESFEDELADIFSDGDSRAFSRAVFWGVVRVGAGFQAGERLTEAIRTEILRTNGSAFHQGDIFAGALFLWWRQNRDRYATFRLLTKWERRDSSRNVIRLFEAVAKGKGQPGATDNPDDAQR